jgi:hypothetical protein
MAQSSKAHQRIGVHSLTDYPDATPLLTSFFPSAFAY